MVIEMVMRSDILIVLYVTQHGENDPRTKLLGQGIVPIHGMVNSRSAAQPNNRERNREKWLPMTCAISPFELLTFSRANSACHLRCLNEHRSMCNDYNASHYSSLSPFLAGAQCLCRRCMAFPPICHVSRNTVSGSSKTKKAHNRLVLIREPQLFVGPNRGNAVLCTWKRPRLDPIWIHADRQWAMTLSIYVEYITSQIHDGNGDGKVTETVTVLVTLHLFIISPFVEQGSR